MTQKAYRKFKRSGTDRCPISGRVAPLVEHHIHGRDIRDADARWNIAWISPDVHDLVHRGEIIIEGWARSTAGPVLLWHRKGEGAATRDASPPLYGQPQGVSPS